MTEKDKELNELRRRVDCLEHKHVADILNHIAFDICDHYCKYAEKYGEDDSALDSYCENCVLLRLMM